MCFVVGLVLLLERPRKRTISLSERTVTEHTLTEQKVTEGTLTELPTAPGRPPRSVGDEAEEWLHKHA